MSAQTEFLPREILPIDEPETLHTESCPCTLGSTLVASQDSYQDMENSQNGGGVSYRETDWGPLGPPPTTWGHIETNSEAWRRDIDGNTWEPPKWAPKPGGAPIDIADSQAETQSTLRRSPPLDPDCHPVDNAAAAAATPSSGPGPKSYTLPTDGNVVVTIKINPPLPEDAGGKKRNVTIKIDPPRAEEDDARTTVTLITQTDKREGSGTD